MLFSLNPKITTSKKIRNSSIKWYAIVGKYVRIGLLKGREPFGIAFKFLVRKTIAILRLYDRPNIFHISRAHDATVAAPATADAAKQHQGDLEQEKSLYGTFHIGFSHIVTPFCPIG